MRETLLSEYRALPVFLSDDLVKRYYNGFSNDVLWPLFHYVPLPMYKVRPSPCRLTPITALA